MSRPLYAILIDGGFFTKKLYQQLGRHATADDIVAECDKMKSIHEVSDYELLRIYYYDAPPSSRVTKRPVSRQTFNLSTTDRYRMSQSLYDQLVLKPHFALRMGETALSPNEWRLKQRTAKEIIKSPSGKFWFTLRVLRPAAEA
jgi:hypothetical protein